MYLIGNIQMYALLECTTIYKVFFCHRQLFLIILAMDNENRPENGYLHCLFNYMCNVPIAIKGHGVRFPYFNVMQTQGIHTHTHAHAQTHTYILLSAYTMCGDLISFCTQLKHNIDGWVQKIVCQSGLQLCYGGGYRYVSSFTSHLNLLTYFQNVLKHKVVQQRMCILSCSSDAQYTLPYRLKEQTPSYNILLYMRFLFSYFIITDLICCRLRNLTINNLEEKKYTHLPTNLDRTTNTRYNDPVRTRNQQSTYITVISRTRKSTYEQIN